MIWNIDGGFPLATLEILDVFSMFDLVKNLLILFQTSSVPLLVMSRKFFTNVFWNQDEIK